MHDHCSFSLFSFVLNKINIAQNRVKYKDIGKII